MGGQRAYNNGGNSGEHKRHARNHPEGTRANGAIHSSPAIIGGEDDTNTDKAADGRKSYTGNDPIQTATSCKYRRGKGQQREPIEKNKIRKMRKAGKTDNATQENNRGRW